MDILICKTFGLGNAVMAVPMIKALESLRHVGRLDVLIGSTKDDVGAHNVFKHLWIEGHIDNLYVDDALDHDYDVAILSIPFDGRWKNGLHFHADEVMDGRTRPDPNTIGLVSWNDHESLYQIENARKLGYASSIIPSTSFMRRTVDQEKAIYLGVGYKKDDAGFWSIKHWGNDKFAKFIELFLDEFKDWKIISTGDILDWKLTLQKLKGISNRCEFSITSLDTAMEQIQRCPLYVGNDTGMMHVADAFESVCIVPFFLDNSITKARPFNDMGKVNSICIDSHYNDVSPEEMMVHVRSVICKM